MYLLSQKRTQGHKANFLFYWALLGGGLSFTSNPTDRDVAIFWSGNFKVKEKRFKKNRTGKKGL
mgnify:CR=1 FL=1